MIGGRAIREDLIFLLAGKLSRLRSEMHSAFIAD
jgi:hypothetical protein